MLHEHTFAFSLMQKKDYSMRELYYMNTLSRLVFVVDCHLFSFIVSCCWFLTKIRVSVLAGNFTNPVPPTSDFLKIES